MVRCSISSSILALRSQTAESQPTSIHGLEHWWLWNAVNFSGHVASGRFPLLIISITPRELAHISKKAFC
jgi:hypothetical protein